MTTYYADISFGNVSDKHVRPKEHPASNWIHVYITNITTYAPYIAYSTYIKPL